VNHLHNELRCALVATLMFLSNLFHFSLGSTYFVVNVIFNYSLDI
jgi:hypothetical protein